MSESGLKPINLLKAAEADLRRREHNTDRSQSPPYEQYAFHRNHVKAAKSAADLLQRAAEEPTIGSASAKKSTRLIYGDISCLTAAIQIMAKEGSR